MVQTNKVLTVSYGTFSCTLEGFDDSFGTMKAIAEYFRDLAADDRYFGAEPPQPDADFLARIAQKEIARRVDARADGNAIVLRAHEEEAEAAVEPAPVAEAPVAKAPVVETPVAAEPVAEAAPVIEPEVEVAEETAPVDVAPVSEDVAEDVVEPVQQAETAEAPVETAVDAMIEDAVADLTLEEAHVAEAAAEIELEAEVEPEPEAEVETAQASTAPDVDSIAAKLQRIRDVVARDQTLAPADPLHEDAGDSALLDAIADATGDLTADDAAEETAEDAADDADLDALAAIQDAVAESVQAPEAAEELYEDAEELAEEVTAEVAEPAPFNLAAFQAVADAAGEAADEEDGDGEDTLFAGLGAGQDGADEGFDDYEDDDFDEDEDEMSNILADQDAPAAPSAETAAGRARVIKVKRADLEAAIERGSLEAIDEEEDTSLSADEEADLMRELAQVEAEFAGAPADVQTDAATAQPDADMPRLLAEAGQKMEEEESAANRETYAQLRAAVAATKAEQQVSGDPKLLSLDEEYRNDLANVVKPDRPMTRPITRPVTKEVAQPAITPTSEAGAKAAGKSGGRPAGRGRPTTEIVAPLKLVAEQRVDGADDAPRQPVRPRRVTTELLDDGGTDAGDQDQSGFVTFADKVGANGLSELLEAAAAYMSYVEGREKFSRPQLMTKVRQVEKEDFNREDGLRSFGQLLREGKIQKAGGGRFTASPEIGFRPDQRAAG